MLVAMMMIIHGSDRDLMMIVKIRHGHDHGNGNDRGDGSDRDRGTYPCCLNLEGFGGCTLRLGSEVPLRNSLEDVVPLCI